MGLGGFILGGALSGIGAGMQAQVEQTALERREARLTEARQAERKEDRSNKIADMDYAKTAAAQSQETDFQNKVSFEGIEQKNRLGLAGAANTAEETRAKAQHTRKLEILTKEYGFRATESENERTFQTQKELGKPIETTVDQKTGELILIYKDPDQENGVRAVRLKGIDTRKPEKSEDSGLLTRPRTPAAAAKGNAQAAAKAPPLREAPTSKGTVTATQINELAKAKNISVEEARKFATANGYVLGK